MEIASCSSARRRCLRDGSSGKRLSARCSARRRRTTRSRPVETAEENLAEFDDDSLNPVWVWRPPRMRRSCGESYTTRGERQRWLWMLSRMGEVPASCVVWGSAQGVLAAWLAEGSTGEDCGGDGKQQPPRGRGAVATTQASTRSVPRELGRRCPGAQALCLEVRAQTTMRSPALTAEQDLPGGGIEQWGDVRRAECADDSVFGERTVHERFLNSVGS